MHLLFCLLHRPCRALGFFVNWRSSGLEMVLQSTSAPRQTSLYVQVFPGGFP